MMMVNSEHILSRQPFTHVSALFDSADAVERLIPSLIWAGVPRDLIEVVVTPRSAARFGLRDSRGPGRETVRFAGVGGLVGLLVGAVISLGMIALPGFASPGTGAIAQLLGPNLATLAGAVGGALIGLFVRRRSKARHRRAAAAGEAVLVVVRARGQNQVTALLQHLREAGGRDLRTET